MYAWYGKPERSKVSPAEEPAKLGAALPGTDLSRPEIRRHSIRLRQAVGVIALDDFWKQPTEPYVIGAKHGQAVKRHLVDELQEAFVDTLHTAVVIQMFTIEICHRHDRRREL